MEVTTRTEYKLEDESGLLSVVASSFYRPQVHLSIRIALAPNGIHNKHLQLCGVGCQGNCEKSWVFPQPNRRGSIEGLISCNVLKSEKFHYKHHVVVAFSFICSTSSFLCSADSSKTVSCLLFCSWMTWRNYCSDSKETCDWASLPDMFCASLRGQVY